MVKTAAAVLICLLVSMVVDREDMRIYSSIAALLCVQPYAEDTKRMAIQRTVGTAIGSVFGIATLLMEMALDIRGTLVGYIVIAAVSRGKKKKRAAVPCGHGGSGRTDMGTAGIHCGLF